MHETKRILPGLAIAAGLLTAQPAAAIDVLSGDYFWPGDGVNAALVYGQHQKATSLHVDGAGDVAGSELSLNLSLLRAVAYREIGGQKLAFQAIMPLGDISTARIGGANQPVSDGAGDLLMAVSWWPMASSEPTGTTLAMTAYLAAPTGDYEIGKVNLGTGTWTLTPQIGVIQGLGNNLFLEATVDASISRDKTHAGVEISTDTSYQFQTYLRYQTSATTNFSVGYSGKRGGKQSVDGVYSGLKTDSDQIRLNASTFLNPTTQLSGMIAKDFNTKGGFENDVVALFRVGFLF